METVDYYLRQVFYCPHCKQNLTNADLGMADSLHVGHHFVDCIDCNKSFVLNLKPDGISAKRLMNKRVTKVQSIEQVPVKLVPTNLTNQYLLNTEQICGLIDIARFNDVRKVSPFLRSELLIQMAHAVVHTLYAGYPYPTPDDFENPPTPVTAYDDLLDRRDHQVMITFSPISTLSNHLADK
jgi:hypothetical protein